MDWMTWHYFCRGSCQSQWWNWTVSQDQDWPRWLARQVSLYHTGNSSFPNIIYWGGGEHNQSHFQLSFLISFCRVWPDLSVPSRESCIPKNGPEGGGVHGTTSGLQVWEWCRLQDPNKVTNPSGRSLMSLLKGIWKCLQQCNVRGLFTFR